MTAHRTIRQPRGGCVDPTSEQAPDPDPSPARAEYPITRLVLAAVGVFILGVLIMFVANAGYTIWQVHQSQHVWCDTIHLLNQAPVPPASTQVPSDTATRRYVKQLATYERELGSDFQTLRGRLGC
jgi:hypothetical protein